MHPPEDVNIHVLYFAKTVVRCASVLPPRIYEKTVSDSRSKGVHNVRSIKGGILNSAEPHAQEIDKVKENTEKIIVGLEIMNP